MAIILRQTPIGRRAFFIEAGDLSDLIKKGEAQRCEGYDIFEEVTQEGVSQGYLTRNMSAITAGKQRRARKPKEGKDMIGDDENVEVVEEEAAGSAEVESSESEEGEAGEAAE